MSLASDTAPLVASNVDLGGDECHYGVCDVKISAPLQVIDTSDPSVPKVTILGLVVDISHAILEGDDDQPFTVNQLAVGQFVELMLDATKLPSLVGTRLEVQNSSNGVDVEVIDERGKAVNDPVNDIKADVTIKHGKKITRFRTTSNGSFRLAGLPPGKAKIAVTRVHDGHRSTASRSVQLRGNSTKHLQIRLKQVR